MEKLLSHEFLEEEFTNVDEDLADDLSGICISMVKNVHDESVEMTVDVFGEDGIDDAPIVSEIVCDPDEYLGKNFDQPAICPRCLIQLFDDKLINLLVARRMKIIWNRDWQSEVIIDPANLHQTAKLEAEDQ